MVGVVHPLLLEREREIRALTESLESTCEGEGGVVLVEGETGMGKSELLTAAVDMASDLEMTVSAARGTELERHFPFGVLVTLLEPLVVDLDRAGREQVLDGPPALAAPLFPTLRDAGAEMPEDPFAVVHGLFRLVARLAERSPLVLAVDDAQWLDERSVQALRYLGGRAADLPVLVLTAGSSEGPAPNPALDALGRVASLRLRLAPLSVRAVARLARTTFPDADQSFCAGCARATAGVPLLVREMLAGALADGIEPTRESALRLARVGLHEVGRAVLRRLERMPAGTSALARTAAVLGDDADLALAAHLAGLALRDAAVAHDALCAAGIADLDDMILLRHPIVREALAASVPPAGRAVIHLRAAQRLLGEAATPERVAGHLLLAEQGGRRWVVETLRRAAARAMADGSPASASRFLERALAEPPPDEGTAAQLRLDLARTEAAAGSPAAPARIRAALDPVEDVDERTRALADLVHVPASVDRPAVVRAFADGLRLAVERGADPEATRWLEATLLAEAREHPDLRARARRLLGAAGTAVDATPAGRALMAQRALEAALAGHPAADVRDLAEYALGRGALLAEDRPGGPHVTAAAMALALADDLQSAELLLGVAVERARASGSPEAYARVCAVRADVSLRRGSLADAVADARAALVAGADGPAATARAALALALAAHGDADEAEEVLAGVEHPAAVAGPAGRAHAPAATPYGEAHLLCARARGRRQAGDAEGAVADAVAAGERLQALRADAPALLAWRTEAALAAVTTDPAGARDLATTQLDLARRSGAPRALAGALRTVAAVDEDPGRRLARLEEAAAVLEGTHAALDRAETLADLGAALVAAGRGGEGRAPLHEAYRLARRAGALVLETRVGRALADAGDPVRHAEPADAATLTPVERRIVDLATDGLSAEEVADAMFTTTKAVDWHLRSASRKLGARSRRELLRSLSVRLE